MSNNVIIKYLRVSYVKKVDAFIMVVELLKTAILFMAFNINLTTCPFMCAEYDFMRRSEFIVNINSVTLISI